MLSSLGKEKIQEFIIEALSKENYYLAKIFASKPFRVSEVERITSENGGVIIGASVIFGDIDEAVSKVIAEEESSNFFVGSNEEGVNTLNKFLEERKIKEKSEKLITSQEIDTKIKEVIKKYTPKGNEEKIEEIFNLVKEAENKSSEKVTEIMVTVFKMGYNQSQTTEIFMANSNLKVNKNTLVIKRDIKEED